MQKEALSRVLNQCYIATLAIGVLAIVALYGASWAIALTFPYSINYEGVAFWASWQVAHGMSIYDPARLHSEPWIVNIYPPLMPMIGSLFAGDPIRLLLGLRAISVAGAVATCVFLFLLLRRFACSAGASLVAIIFLMSAIPVWYTTMVAKPDYLCIGLLMGALYFFCRQNKSATMLAERSDTETGTTVSPWYLPAAALTVLAVLAKQQALVVAATIVICLLLQRRFLSAIKYISVVVLTLLLCVGSTQLLTHGVFEYYSFLKQLRPDPQNAPLILSTFGFDAVKMILIVIGAVPFLVRKNYNAVLVPAGILFVVSLAQALATLPLPGATSNHFIVPMIALSMLAAVVATRYRWFGAVLAMVSVMLVQPQFELFQKQTSDVAADAKNMQQFLPHGVKVLSEDPLWVMVGEDKLGIVDCNIFESIWRYHPEMEQALIEKIDNKEYGAIILSHMDVQNPGSHIWSKQVVDAVTGNYRLAGTATGNGIKQDIFLPH